MPRCFDPRWRNARATSATTGLTIVALPMAILNELSAPHWGHFRGSITRPRTHLCVRFAAWKKSMSSTTTGNTRFRNWWPALTFGQSAILTCCRSRRSVDRHVYPSTWLPRLHHGLRLASPNLRLRKNPRIPWPATRCSSRKESASTSSSRRHTTTPRQQCFDALYHWRWPNGFVVRRSPRRATTATVHAS